MKRILLECLLLMFLLSGCGAPDDINISSIESEGDNAKRIVALADVDFAIVPDFSYHVLLEEKMNSENTQLIRQYVKYDGFNNTITETVQEIPLAHREEDVAAARNWLKKNKPASLKIYPHTFLSESVRSQWEDADYDASIEAKELISLENLKKLGAISRLNEAFVIKKKPDEMTTIIEAVESEYLPRAENVMIDRELEALQRSFTYKIKLVLYAGPVRNSTQALTTAIMQLKYRVDELGNPLELNFEISFEDHTMQGKQKQSNMNETGIFLVEMREILIRELGLYGVVKHNPSLTYTNVTLNYEGVEETSYVAEKFYIH
ncbi:MAG: hypothetical protein GX922_07485 [Firmicutes bacterium]|nr:hypothetical protein [Bacillota bacterium]